MSFLALEKMPEGVLDPLSAHAKLVSSSLDDRAFVPQTRLLEGACAGVASDAITFVADLETSSNRFPDLRGALPKGVTATFELVRDRTVRPETARRERVALHVYRPPGPGSAVTFALEVTGTRKDGVPANELAQLDTRALALGQGFAVIVDSPFDDARAIAAVATVNPPPAEGAPGAAAHREAVALCTADLAREDVLAKERAAAIRPATLPRPDLGEALRALDEPTRRRPALFFLAQAVGAPVTEDVALSGNESMLAHVSSAVAASARAPDAPGSGPELAWLVERATFEGLGETVSGSVLPPEVEAVLVRRGGAVGRSLVTFYGIVNASTSLDDFEQKLESENRDLLEDSSAAIRVRACEWLAARSLAPNGYDPLGPAPERRTAIDRAASELEAKGERP